ncbi:hypothetical protein EV200_105266 [Pedobacter psychrotolerans]|uniref:Uncharacterized protein n=1 Tax=Pedobacter psychrotolerans TaxID=1843235 RepID=A0A4R2H9N5_9SPHI|nr:hypothetical protein [Pedobacter psychrotolerans]TCO23797.1 hypothetical protein EV200_105266 [Pedobacter psychrotolerans]GGE62684.1 hypothetical protein GCM10011413_31330 [Pedobacter psychrotolerans]
MNLISFKYLLIICIAATLFLKVSNAVSYLRYSTAEIEYSSVNDDATEKEEKKIESEYLANHFYSDPQAGLFFVTDKKLLIPDHSFKMTYFPEVLTPPPLA